MMTMKQKGRIAVLAVLCFTLVGYSSAALSLSHCDAQISPWLANGLPGKDFATSCFAEPASMFLPFVAKASFERKWHPHDSLHGPWYTEQGTRYYFTLFGLVIPIGTSSEVWNVVA